MARSARQSSLYDRIYAVVRQVPHGRVATYGQVARLAGLPRRARLVGYALHAAPDGLQLPWHRIINASGRISLPRESGHYDYQKALLVAEGVTFRSERIDLSRFQWTPGAAGDVLYPPRD